MATEDDTTIPFDACAHCGAPLERGVRYPAEARDGPDGKPELYSFCDRDCQRAWTEGDD